MKKILSILVLLVAISYVQAQVRPPRGVPATPYPIEVAQPNGDTITIRLFGDERGSYRTTMDGYVIVENRRGYYCYAKENRKGEIVATYRRVRKEEDRRKCELRYLEKMRENKKLYRPRNH